MSFWHPHIKITILILALNNTCLIVGWNLKPHSRQQEESRNNKDILQKLRLRKWEVANGISIQQQYLKPGLWLDLPMLHLTILILPSLLKKQLMRWLCFSLTVQLHTQFYRATGFPQGNRDSIPQGIFPDLSGWLLVMMVESAPELTGHHGSLSCSWLHNKLHTQCRPCTLNPTCHLGL